MWASVWAVSLGSSTTLTKFLTKYLPSSYFASCHTLVRIWKISCQGFFLAADAECVRYVFCFLFLSYFALLSLCCGCNTLEDYSYDSTLASPLQGSLPGKHPGNRMLLQYMPGNTEEKKQQVRWWGKFLQGQFTVCGWTGNVNSESCQTEVGAVSSFTVRNSTISKSTSDIWSILWAEKTWKKIQLLSI